MYQFNGWVVLCHNTLSDDRFDEDEIEHEKAVERFIEYISEVDGEGLSVIKRLNGLDSFMISGMHNHKAEYVIDIFRWIGKNLPYSYGLLYVKDDEEFPGL